MAFDHRGSTDNDYKRQLQGKYDCLLKEKKDLEDRKQKAQEVGQTLKDKSHEYQALRDELVCLINQKGEFVPNEPPVRPIDVSGNTGNSDLAGLKSLSWDFEGLAIAGQANRPELAGPEEITAQAIACIEAAISEKENEMELVQKQMTGQIEDVKRSEDLRYSPNHLQTNQTQQMNDVIMLGNDVSLSPSMKIRELENINELMSKRIEELLENAETLKNHIGLLTKQKEELLQVNHQWDDQYKQLKADKERLRAELHESYQARETVQVQQQEPLEVNHEETTQFIEELTKQNEELNEKVACKEQEIVALKEQRQKQDTLWVAARKMINEERQARESAVQGRQAKDEYCKQLEDQLEVARQTEGTLKEEIKRLTAVSGQDKAVEHSQVPSAGNDKTEQIEMLKQQISVYADDFANERADRERIQAEREAQKERLKEFEREIYLLKEQIRVYRHDFEKERRDKERLQRQLRGGQVEEPWYMVPPNDYVSMHSAQRRPQQPLYQDRQYRYTPREIQELAFQQQQQPLHPRGQVGHPGGLCHGCEADCDVIDGNVTLKCPRCERVFDSNERRSFEEHIDKCTT